MDQTKNLLSAEVEALADGLFLFGSGYAGLGIIYQLNGIMRLINVVGLANAKEMELVHYALPPDQRGPFTYELAQEIGGNALLSLRHELDFGKSSKNQRLDPEYALEIEAPIFRLSTSKIWKRDNGL